jgi:hypothetical protein
MNLDKNISRKNKNNKIMEEYVYLIKNNEKTLFIKKGTMADIFA